MRNPKPDESDLGSRSPCAGEMDAMSLQIQFDGSQCNGLTNNLQKDQLNFYKSKEDLFYLLNIPSSLAVSRNKIIEKYLPKVDRFLSNNYIITITLNYFTNINGKITITYYLFFDLVIIYILKLFTNDIISLLILLLFTLVDIFVNRYLLEEIVNKFLEFILSFSLLIFLFEIVNLK